MPNRTLLLVLAVCVTADTPVTSRQRVLSLSVPQKSKQTVMITGSPAEAAKELVRRLREEARVL